MEWYRGTEEGISTTGHMGVPFPEDGPGLLSYVQSFTTNYSEALIHAAPVLQISHGRDRNRNEDGTAHFLYNNIHSPSKKAEMCSFTIFVRIGNNHSIYRRS